MCKQVQLRRPFFSISRAKFNMETHKKNGFSRSKFTGKSKFLTVNLFIFLAIFALWKVWPVRINHLSQYSSCCFLVEITHMQITTIISL